MRAFCQNHVTECRRWMMTRFKDSKMEARKNVKRCHCVEIEMTEFGKVKVAEILGTA